MNQDQFLNSPTQRVKIGSMSKTVKTDFMEQLTREPAAKLPGDANSGYNGVDSVPQSNYSPGSEQVRPLPFRHIQ